LRGTNEGIPVEASEGLHGVQEAGGSIAGRRNDSAAAAATSPAYGAGGMGTEAAAETTSPESSSDTGTEEAASVSMSAATSMSGADAEEVVERLRWAARWSAKGKGRGKGRLVRAWDLDGREREDGNGFAGGD